LSFGSLLSLGAGLALVLGLFAILVRVLRRLRPDLMASRKGPTLTVLSRQPLSPRQGVAVAQFRDRLLLLSYGEGGIRLLQDVPDGSGADDTLHVGEMNEKPCPVALDPLEGSNGNPDLSFPRVWNRVRRAAGMGGGVMLLLALAGPPAILSAEEPVLTGGAIPTQVVQGEPPAAVPSAPPSMPPSALQPGTSEGALMDLARQLPSMDLQIGEEEGLSISGPVGTVLFIGFLTLLPTVLLMMTGFTRILVVLHLLKQAMGTQTAPPAQLLAAMALLLTGFVMAPTLAEVNRTALGPWMDGEMDEVEMMTTASGPFRTFMLGATREEDLSNFMDMHGGEPPETVDQIPLVVLASAFVTSELRHAFQIGFALFLPFVVIDIVVASVLMSMGMFMLPPVMVSLPFKLLLFVLVDGWSLVVGGLVQSFV